MIAYIVDDSGRSWDAGSALLADELACSFVGSEQRDLIVKNSGYIELKVLPKYLEIRMCPRTVTEPAFVTAMNFVFDHAIGRCLLNYYDDQWRPEIFQDKKQMLQRAIDLISKHSEQNNGAYLARRRALDSLPADHPLEAVYQLWRDNSGKYDAETYRAAMQKLNGARYMVLDIEQGNSELVFREVGAGVGLYDTSWPQKTVGLRMQDQPDFSLGKWVVEAYRDTILAGHPRLDDIDLIVRRPRQSKYHTRYQRIILPLSGDDKHTVLSAVSMDSSLNLRDGFKKVGEIAVD